MHLHACNVRYYHSPESELRPYIYIEMTTSVFLTASL